LRQSGSGHHRLTTDLMERMFCANAGGRQAIGNAENTRWDSPAHCSTCMPPIDRDHRNSVSMPSASISIAWARPCPES